MLNLQQIYKSYDGKSVLSGINLALNVGDVTALVGENGSGKTTILKLIMGEIVPDGGSVIQQNETIGYVPQEFCSSTNIRGAFVQDIEDWRIEHALSIVGLGYKPLWAQISELSGGQKTRLSFARVLANNLAPTILLLDEPTNNLDAVGLRWLEGFISNFDGAIILVSHDRTFINNTCNRVAELNKGRIKEYGGNYDFYVSQKQIEQKTDLDRFENNQKERKRLVLAIINQSEKSQHTHKHIKRNDNDKYQRDYFRNRVTTKYGQQANLLDARLNQLEEFEKPESTKDYKIFLQGSVPNTKLIISLEDVTFSYENQVLDGVGFQIRGDERLRIKGANGSGKTTLLKIAAGLIKADGGERIVGADVSIGYFSQDVDGLDYGLSAIANLESLDVNSTAIFRTARILGLTVGDLRKMPMELSRGQQAKLAFTKLLLGKYQLLVLDEPTNHLDIPTREKIETALQNYRGAILFASHDSYFANKLKHTKELKL